MPEKDAFKGGGLLNLLLVAAFFVSPLLFFTDLTRNPYYLQITLLNVSLLAAMAVIALNAFLRRGNFLPGSPLNIPAAYALAVYLSSFIYAYFNHAAFFRPAMASEGLKTALFIAVNCFFVFYLSLRTPFAGVSKLEEPGAGKWLALMLLWGALWFLFPFAKTPAAAQDFWSRFWDPYGGLLWLGGVTAVYLALKKPARQEDVLVMIMSAAGIAALYGVLEYFHVELIWAKLVNPYGNRSVSTFGNPNFISSYVVMLLPLTVYYLMEAETLGARVFYGILFFSYEGMLLASLTRSSWIGAAAAFIFLFSFRAVRGKFSANKKFLVPFFAAALVVLVFWPSASLKPFSSGLFERVSEVTAKINSTSALSLSVAREKVYSSFHQRLLIWTSAWQMGLENPLLGKGEGLFELFYPFYQGNLIYNYEAARNLRTHANNAHNEILEQWSQAGLLGLGAYLWFFFTLAAGFYFYHRRSAPEAVASAVPFAAALAGMFADNMFNVSLHFAVPGLLFWWLTGALALKVFTPSVADGARGPRQAGVTVADGARGPRQARVTTLYPLPSTLRWPGRAGLAALICLCLITAVFWQRQFAREFYYFNGFKEMRRNNFAQAALELKKAYDRHSREVNSNYEMANAFVRAGEPEKAEWAYGEALKANAGYDEIYFNLAVVQKRAGKSLEAAHALETSVFINPLNPPVYQALAEVYIAEATAPAAGAGARIFSDAVKMFPNDGNMWNTLGYFYNLQKDLPKARAAYGRGVRADPENRMLAENLAGAAARMKIKSDPDLQWLARYADASGGLSGGDIKQAVKTTDILLNLDPANVKVVMLKAKLLFKAGDIGGAETLLSSLLEKDPADNSARYGLAAIYEKEGDFSRARAEWGIFLQFEPGNAAVAARLKALP